MEAKQASFCPSPPLELARAYIPFQNFNQVLPPPEGLREGTIFPELIRPYYPEDNWGVCKNGA